MIEITEAHIQPKIGQLKLIFVVSILLLLGWFYSLYCYNKTELGKDSWCIDWNRRTTNEWYYDTEIGCVLDKDS